MFTSLRKKIAVDEIVYPWNIGLTCGNCSLQFTVTRRKKNCVFCNTSFCTLCIERRPDKRLSCHKCVVLTARPLDREQLLNLKSRDLVAYLSSRHISTTNCIEKEDLVNAVIRSVHVPPYSSVIRSNSGSCPTSPNHADSAANVPSTSYSHDDLRSVDSIRVAATNMSSSSSATSPEAHFVVVNHEDTVRPESPSLGNAEAGGPGPTIYWVTPEGDLEPNFYIPEPPTPPIKRRLLISDIPDIQYMEGLSIRQLKELLAFNRIGFTGCVERSELMEKVTRLWLDYKDTRKDVTQLAHEDLCKICMDAPIECVLLECGHTCACTQCGKQLSECPICRQFVVRCVRTFKA